MNKYHTHEEVVCRKKRINKSKKIVEIDLSPDSPVSTVSSGSSVNEDDTYYTNSNKKKKYSTKN